MNEQSRLKELYRYHILDTKPEVELDELAEIASVICSTPMSLITMVDKKRTWHKSKYGFDTEKLSEKIHSVNIHYLIQKKFLLLKMHN